PYDLLMAPLNVRLVPDWKRPTQILSARTKHPLDESGASFSVSAEGRTSAVGASSARVASKSKRVVTLASSRHNSPALRPRRVRGSRDRFCRGASRLFGMDSQNYANHRHNPKPTGIGFFFWLIAVVGFGFRWFGIGGRWSMALGVGGLLGVTLALLSLSRSYTTALQDRIIKLEMRVRTSTLLTPQQQAELVRLSKPQIIALRFASDTELPSLVERASRDNLTADQIKRAITTWVPDQDRT